MGIVIDINTIPPVFDCGNKMHKEFKPVYKWILRGKGKMVYGGMTYKNEIAKMVKFRRLILQLENANKVDFVSDNAVDTRERMLKSKLVNKNFNDAHIIAIVIISHCRLVCSVDKKSYVFLKDKSLYPKGFERPRIYRGKSNANLLFN